MIIKPIETLYKGYRFRSRLEARWAIFFDILNLDWAYEHEGFVLPNNELYLPDFWLSGLNCFAEVKPMQFSESEFNKCVMLNQCCLLLDSQTPLSNHGYYCTNTQSEYNNYCSGDEFMRILIEMSAEKKRLWVLLGESIDDYCFDNQPEQAAKSARFEYGENHA